MNDPTALPPPNGSPPDDLPQPDLLNGAGPSLAPSFQPHSTPTSIPAPPAALSPLEERLRRLEDALAQVADPKQIEARIADRVAERLTTERPIPVAQVVPPAPASAQGSGVTIPTGMILDVGRRLLSSTAGLTAPEAHQESAPLNHVRRPFLFFDLLTEARAIWHMFTDPRYKMSWLGRLVPLVLAVFLLTSQYLVPGGLIPYFGTFIDKAFDFIPAFILFKWLSYEARRYRETAPNLPPDLRL